MMKVRKDLGEAMQRFPSLIGERLCLDFVNTIEPRGHPQIAEEERASQREYLTSYSDFLAWCVLTGMMKREEAEDMQTRAMLQESQAQETLKHIIELREKLYALLWHMASFQNLEEEELAWLQGHYLNALTHARLVGEEGHYVWHWQVEKDDLASPTWPIVQSALELVTTGDSKRVKICPGDPTAPIACAWLFYDESKNRSRHWCSMADCGTRTKARRLTARRREKRKKQGC